MPGLVHLVSNIDCLLASPLLHLQATLELLADHATVAQQQELRTVPELLYTRQLRQVLIWLRQLLLCLLLLLLHQLYQLDLPLQPLLHWLRQLLLRLQKELLFLLLQLDQMEHPSHPLLHWLSQILLLLLGLVLQLNQLECPFHPNRRLPF